MNCYQYNIILGCENMRDIFMYISEEEYYRVCEEIDDGQTINIYKSKNIEIDIKRSGKKIYKFIADYGECSLNECLEDMYLKKVKIII